METTLIDMGSAELSVSTPEMAPPETGGSSKTCPFCAEQIQSAALKCRHCGEFLDGRGCAGSQPRPKKWYFATGTVVMALMCLGPLALPLVWLNPRYKPITRAIITLIVLAVTIGCMVLMGAAYQQVLDQLQLLKTSAI